MAIRIGICGVAGRMGKTLVRLCQQDPGLILTAAIEIPGHPQIGEDAGQHIGIGHTAVSITDDLAACLERVDVVINFMLPEALSSIIASCVRAHKPIVIGTTGLTVAQEEELLQAAKIIAIIYAPNMSVGINISFKLLEIVARAMGEGSDIEVFEAHHRDKKDAPSGTALKMGETIANTLGLEVNDCGVFSRHGQLDKRKSGSIGFQTIRAGDIVGEHTAMFVADGERLEITHKASNRDIFAAGALRAAKWVNGKAAGKYGMQDVLGL